MADVFPSLLGNDLNKVSKTIPDDFCEQHLIAIVAFQQWHQQSVDRTIEHLEHHTLDALYEIIEIPVIQKTTRFRQIRLDSLMRAAIRDHRVRSRTITVYLDKQEFRASLGIHNEETIHWFVIHRENNTILLRGEGIISSADIEQITALCGP